MLLFPAMLYWECKRRSDQLRQFRTLVIEYFNNTSRQMFHPPTENDKARQARVLINKLMAEIIRSFDLVGATRVMYYSPPPAVGGFAGPVDVFSMLFELWRFEIDLRIVLDLLDRAIGEYDQQAKRVFRQMFNPFF